MWFCWILCHSMYATIHAQVGIQMKHNFWALTCLSHFFFFWYFFKTMCELCLCGSNRVSSVSPPVGQQHQFPASGEGRKHRQSSGIFERRSGHQHLQSGETRANWQQSHDTQWKWFPKKCDVECSTYPVKQFNMNINSILINNQSWMVIFHW